MSMKKSKQKVRVKRRFDPSRTTTLRRQIETEVSKRFTTLLKSIISLVVEDDAFGLRADKSEKSKVSNLDSNSEMILNTRWRFESSAAQLRLFEEWLRSQSTAVSRDTDAAYRLFLRKGFDKGAGRAFTDTQRARRLAQEGADDAIAREQFLRSAFAQPVAKEKVQLVASRLYSQLNGITHAMGVRMGQVLADGLVTGSGPKEIARSLARHVGISRNRAKAIARTEILRAHNEGQLIALERLGVKSVGVMVEIKTVGDERVCQLCLPLEGVVLKLKEAKGILPRHINCRCVWIPANVGESRKKQTRGQKKIQASFDKSIRAERRQADRVAVDKTDRSKPDTSWMGADTKIDPIRPESVVGNKTYASRSNDGDPLVEFSRLLKSLAQR